MANRNKNSNRIRDRRLERGLTQTELADRAGISRTAVTAIEGAKLVPSVATALSLASALECTVEDLFGSPVQPSESASWAWEPTTNSTRCWQAEVFGRTLKYPATASPMWTVLPDQSVDRPTAGPTDSRETLVIACCDPAAGLLASLFQRATGMRLIVIPRSSSQALELLQQGLVHLAGLHFSTADYPQRNSDVVGTRLAGQRQVHRFDCA